MIGPVTTLPTAPVNAPNFFVAQGRELRLTRVESRRRKTLGIEVHPHALDGARLVVHMPTGTPWSELEPRLARREGWIARQAAEFDRYRPATPPRQYLAGETFRLLGRQLLLTIGTGRQGVALKGNRLTVCVPNPNDREAVSAVLARWYHAQAKAEFVWRLERWLQHPLLQPAPATRLLVRKLARRWGSLSPAGTLTLNTALVQKSAACIDYVIVHELCHHWHPDHGASFYQLVTDVIPNWQTAKSLLERG